MGGRVIAVVVIVIVFLDGRTRGPTTYGEAARDVCGGRRARHAHWAGAATDGRADGKGGRNGTMRGIETGLDKVLALRLCDEGLEFCGGEGVNKAGLGDDQKKDLGSGEGGELVCLFHNACFPF
jgi:hypothetical protein